MAALIGTSFTYNAQFYDSYSIRLADPAAALTSDYNVELQGSERVPSQIYHDLGFAYTVAPSTRGTLSGVRVELGIQNLFDKKPPVIAALIGGYSQYGDPRLRRFSLTVRKSFGK
jgi:iron complex outermembrane receptor protein